MVSEGVGVSSGSICMASEMVGRWSGTVGLTSEVVGRWSGAVAGASIDIGWYSGSVGWSSVVITSRAVGFEGVVGGDSYPSAVVVVVGLGGLIGTGTGVVGKVSTSGGGWDSLVVDLALGRHRR